MERQRFLLVAPVRALGGPDDGQARPPAQVDADDVAALMLAAYRGTIDDEGETLEDARAAVAQLFAGAFGAMDWVRSELVRRDGILAAATLVTRWEDRPFVAFSLTAPTHQRQGFARAGLQRLFDRLQAAGEAELRLVVTQGNLRAEALYESLGFRPQAQPPFRTV